MQFQFDPKQPYQERAVASVVDLFQGMGQAVEVREEEFLGTPLRWQRTQLAVDAARLLKNVRTIQDLNGLPPDDALRLLEATEEIGGTTRTVSFPNLSVEMETGTGKTYVYLRTALELNRRYGLKKFIIVVPSVAVREGVLKTFQMTKAHFAELFDNEQYRYDVYDSRNLTRLQDFAGGQGVHFLIMTMASFDKGQNVIRLATDRLGGKVGLHLIQAARPVLILDEPQNMESAGAKKALATLHPLAALRYSATHRDRYNLVYRLTPYEAYRQGLVKKVEVASVLEADSFNAPFIRVEGFATSKRSVKAKVVVHQRMKGGEVKAKAYQFAQGDSLAGKAGRSEYEAFVIDHIDAGERTVTFQNGVVLKEGQPYGAEQEAVFRAQVRFTVEQHMRRQQQFDEAAAKSGGERIKVLSLFFLDKVANYAAADGVVRKFFDEAFDDLKAKYPAWAKYRADQVRGAYFAGKRRKGGGVELFDSKSGDSDDDKKAYALIMREKEQLLSFQEPTAFIFSHSALKEGWDNPNVFQICTLNQTASEMKKRQEIGRGMRLAVDASGGRSRDDKVNLLTVVANESYEDYVAALQAEVAEEFGADEAKKTRPNNANDKRTLRRKPLEELPSEFRELWERIKPKTRYQVRVDTAELVAHAVDDLNLKVVDPPRIEVTKARVEAKGDVFAAMQLSGAKAVATLTGRFPLPNAVEMVIELLGHTAATPVRVTRKTVFHILCGVKNQQAILDNPNEFATVAARVIRDKLEDQLVDGIRYHKDGESYPQELFKESIDTYAGKTIAATKSLYDRFPFDSDVERKFAEKLESRADVLFYVKLPREFVVQTPIGTYNPDWAVVMAETDEFGEKGERLYLVRETKSDDTEKKLYASEFQKVRCGSRHFNDALSVDYRLILSADDLPGGTKVA